MTPDQFLTLDGRPTVRVERRFPHPIEKVWRAVTRSEHLAQWFPVPVEIDLWPGGALRQRQSGGEPSPAGRVEAVDPPRRLTLWWGEDRLTFELTPDEGATIFALTHSFDDRYGAPSFATGWDLCLIGLRQVLAGEPLPPPDRGIARHEELVARFGLDRPEVTNSGDRWTVRVERQLTCPAEIAWDLWFGTDRDTGEQRTAPPVGGELTPYMAPDLVVGIVTEVEPHRVLAFDVTPAGGPGEHVRVELGPGTGHGVRVALTVTGTGADERDAAAQVWGTGAIGHLAAMAAEWATTQPVGA
jgi:uncharacterized protein YndB with AHSA1/START domain